MDPLCDFCGTQRAAVYCSSDSARLCFPCDGYIHSANALSRRHQRTLVCDRCGSQPAIIRCWEDKVSLCQNCDWNGCLGHKQQTLNCYSGCPSLEELSMFLSCINDASFLNEVDGDWGSRMMTANENCVNNCWEQGGNDGSIGLTVKGGLNGLDSGEKLEPWVNSSSAMPNENSIVYGGDRQVSFQETNPAKVLLVCLLASFFFEVLVYLFNSLLMLCNYYIFYYVHMCDILRSYMNVSHRPTMRTSVWGPHGTPPIMGKEGD